MDISTLLSGLLNLPLAQRLVIIESLINSKDEGVKNENNFEKVKSKKSDLFSMSLDGD
jgi:plasmid maintenance system killer protein